MTTTTDLQYPTDRNEFLTWAKQLDDSVYLIIPKYPNYSINKRGMVIDNQTGELQLVRYNAVNYPVVRLTTTSGKKSERMISRLVLHTFIPIPDESFSEFMVYYKDNNKYNYHYNNLNRHIALLQFAYKKDSDYRYVTSNKNYIINSKGTIIGLSSGKEVVGNIGSNGYRRVGLHNSDGTKSMHSVHRLLGFAFLPKPNRLKGIPFSELTINHKDGNPLNNFIDLTNLDNSNLEWMTVKENINHAHDTGLAKFCIPIKIRDIQTNKVMRYRSINQASIKLGIAHTAILERADSKSAVLIDDRYQAKHREDNTKWRKPVKYIREAVTDVAVKVKDIQTGSVVLYTNVAEAAKVLGVHPHSVHQRMSHPNPTLIHTRYAVKTVGDNSPWATQYIKYKVKEDKVVDRKYIKVLNIATGVTSYYDSAVEASTVLGIDVQGIRKRIAGKGIVEHLMNGKYLIKLSSDESPWPTLGHIPTSNKSHSVVAIHPDGTINPYRTVTEMAVAYGVNQSTMSRRVNGTITYDHNGIVFKKAA